MSTADPAFERISVVIPTYQRRDLVRVCIESLGRQRFDAPFEVLVVVDGSTDGTAEALAAMSPPFDLHVLNQGNRGAAVARNAGAVRARGDILLFLDDDMEAHPDLLTEHARSHASGAEAVLGHLPLHPDTAPNVMTQAVRAWTDARLRRLSVPGAPLQLADLLTGQLSVRRSLFEDLGGFDASFTRNGLFGGEDIDFGYRLLSARRGIIFNPAAISWQRYETDARRHLVQWRQAGRSDAELAQKHPELAGQLSGPEFVVASRRRSALESSARVPVAGSLALGALGRVVAWRVDAGHTDRLTRRIFFLTRRLQYLRGFREGGGLGAGGSVVVLAYHAIAVPSPRSALGRWTVSPCDLRRHIDHLAASGYEFIGLDRLLAGIAGSAALPRKGVLITFDDCYEDLLSAAAPVLAERGVPALAFAVSALIGRSNEWDAHLGGDAQLLLDARGLRALEDRGMEIGGHSRTHRFLTRLSEAELQEEVEDCRRELQSAGLRRPRGFAYPHGLFDDRVVAAVKAAGYQAGFTIESGTVTAGSDPFRLPRVEITTRGGRFGLRAAILVARAPQRVRRAYNRLDAPLRPRIARRLRRPLRRHREGPRVSSLAWRP